MASRVLDPRRNVRCNQGCGDRLFHIHHRGMHHEVGWIMYWTMWLAMIVYTVFAVGITWGLCKVMLWFLPGGPDKQDSKVRWEDDEV